MPRIKTLLDEILDILEGLSVLYGLAMLCWWFTNKATFWKWLFYGISFIVVIIIIAIWRRKTKFKHVQGFLSDRELLLKLRKMHFKEFEDYIADLFSKLGYKTEVVGGLYDEGIDVIAEKDSIKHYIQCKRFVARTVAVGAIRDFYGAIIDHLANGKGYFITTNKFTLEAEKFTEDKPIELIDGYKLIEYIRLAGKESGILKSSPAEASIEKLEKCPQCGGDLIEREGKFGKFYGCSKFPYCRGTRPYK